MGEGGVHLGGDSFETAQVLSYTSRDGALSWPVSIRIPLPRLLSFFLPILTYSDTPTPLREPSFLRGPFRAPPVGGLGAGGQAGGFCALALPTSPSLQRVLTKEAHFNSPLPQHTIYIYLHKQGTERDGRLRSIDLIGRSLEAVWRLSLNWRND